MISTTRRPRQERELEERIELTLNEKFARVFEELEAVVDTEAAVRNGAVVDVVVGVADMAEEFA